MMQSNGARVLVALGSIAAIVVLLIVFAGGGDDDGGTTTATQTTTTTTEEDAPGGGSEPEKPEKPDKPEFETIVVNGGEPKGGVRDLTYGKGDRIRLDVRSDVSDEVHVHGYDLSEDVKAGGNARFSFPADIEGVFEVELEDSGVQLAQLTVKP